jgi:hypothetical protein
MRTFVQLAKVAFWMLPVQRVLTAAGLAVVIAELAYQHFAAGPSLRRTLLPLGFSGSALVLILPLLLGGAWLRMLATPRSMQLLPHSRGRLLAGTLAMVLLGALFATAGYWLSVSPWIQPQYRPDAAAYALMFMLTLTFATQCVIGVFIASRGPVWLAIALAAWIAPHVVLPWIGFEDASRVLTGPVGIAGVIAAWTAFTIWFLRVRHINAEGWRRGSVVNAATAAAVMPVLDREQAMTRWVLGAATPLSMGLLWTMCAIVLVGVQLVIGHDSPPRAVSSMLFGTLSLNALVVAAMAHSAAARSRGLWLHGARQREELYRWCERLLLRVAAAILLPFLLIGAALWWWLPERPALPLGYLLAAIIAPGLLSLWFGLLAVRRSAVLMTVMGLTIFAGWYYGVAQPLASGTSQPRWWLLVAQLGLGVVLRIIAARLWRSRDWLRGRRAEPMTG